MATFFIKFHEAKAIFLGLLATVVILMITGLCGAMLYVRAVNALKAEVRSNLIRTATVAAAMVDGDAHQTFTHSRQETTPAYFRAIKPLDQVQKASGDIKYVYTCILRDNNVYFVLDPTPPGDHNGDGIDEKSHIMQLYPDAAPALVKALKTGLAQADEEPIRDEWGLCLSGYAPIRDSKRNLVGIVGVDLTANHYAARLTSMRRAALTGISLAILLALLTGTFVFAGQSRLMWVERSRLRTVRHLQEAHNELERRVAARTAELAEANHSLNQAYTATIEGWSRALDMRDQETQGHSERVTAMTLQLARSMDMTEGELAEIERGALLHDIGKMAVPDAILRKPGPLTEDEWAVMRLHPIQAYEMLSPITFLRPALAIPLYHHEKWDGTGYPSGLNGEEIPLPARLFAIVDVWDALSSDRPYRRAWPQDRVIDHLHSLSGSHFDPQIVQAFLKLILTSEAQREGFRDPEASAIAA